mmetsp:Transcript_25699/g.53676  ORF Transcript_25699/g.53676 Transcript_25699/m.53676 type:complete len:298 (-) Transcript_25699:190-1083(-)
MASSKLDKQFDGGNDDAVVSDLIDSFAKIMPQVMDKYETRFSNVEQSELYKPAGMILPKLPMYHPYHPFGNVTNGDDILQVPLAMILRDSTTDCWGPLLQPPPQLREQCKQFDGGITFYFIAQTLPYNPETSVICRYQYSLFPKAESEMNGHESIWAQSFVYEKNSYEESCYPRVFPATQIKIYESDKRKDVSPTILCGDSMELDTVENLKGRALWSLVLGSRTGDVSVTGDDDDNNYGMFTDVSHAFLGLTYFIPDDDGAYQNFIRSIRDKSPGEILTRVVPGFLDLRGREGFNNG